MLISYFGYRRKPMPRSSWHRVFVLMLMPEEVCCGSKMFPLCNKHLQLIFLPSRYFTIYRITTVASYYSTTRVFSELCRSTWSFTKADCMTRCLVLYTCGNETENTWINQTAIAERLKGPIQPAWFRKDDGSD